MYYYENADTQTYHSEDEIDDDCVDVMCETDMIQNIKFEEETKEKFEHRTFDPLKKSDRLEHTEVPHFRQKRGQKVYNIPSPKKSKIISPKKTHKPNKKPKLECKFCVSRVRTIFECYKCHKPVCKDHAVFVCPKCR